MQKLIACVRDSYADLIEGIERRRIASGLSHAELEHRAGLTNGHYSKILGFGKKYGRHCSMQSLIWILLCLKLELRLYATDEVEQGNRASHMVRAKKEAAA